MRTKACNAVSTVVAVLLLTGTVCLAEDVVVSPHSEKGDCGICHVASAEKLRSWFAFGATKREMKYDLNQVCLRCHTVEPSHAGGFFGVGTGHGVGKKPAANRQDLPLAGDGTITCATTCHNIHVTSDDRLQQRKRLRLPVNSLCLSCHDK